MFKKLFKKAVAAIPKVVRATKKVGSIVKRATSSVPAMLKVAKIATNIAGRLINSKIKKSIKDKIVEIRGKNKRIFDKVKDEWAKADSKFPKKGKITTGAILQRAAFPCKDGCIMLDFLMQSRKAVIEEYPILNWQSNLLKKSVETVRNGVVGGGQSAGKWVYSKNIPIISDCVGEFTKVREKGAKSNYFTQQAALWRGFYVDGALGTVDGIANMVADPIGTIEGLNKIMAYPEETIPAIGKGVAEYAKNLIDGTPEDKAAFVGQVGFEVVSWAVGAGEAKAATTAGKTVNAADKAADIAKTADKTGDLARTADKTADLVTNGNRSVNFKGGVQGDEVNKVVKELAEEAGEGTSRTINTAADGWSFGNKLPVSSLNKRQRALLESLSEPGSTAIVRKKSVSMNDLRQLTNVTGDEFNMFTNKGNRLIIRGEGNQIRVSEEMFDDLLSGKYGKFSGHTHPGYSLNPGPADEPFLKLLGQKQSSIWGNTGRGWEPFGQDTFLTQKIREDLRREAFAKLYGGK